MNCRAKKDFWYAKNGKVAGSQKLEGTQMSGFGSTWSIPDIDQVIWSI